MLAIGFVACGSSGDGDSPVETVSLSYSPKELVFGPEQSEQTITVTCDRDWTAYSNDDWLTCKVSGNTVSVTAAENLKYEERTGEVIVKSGSTREAITVTQQKKAELETGDIVVPEGYRLVWHDEFDNSSISMPDETLWYYETAAPGWVNNELQRYVAGKQGDKVTAEVSHGSLKIRAIKTDSEVISARINTIESWKYGYFEARLNLPTGKGTWPAFWMMPKNFTAWPDDGEIDIMEEVGCDPNQVSSSIHCKAYYHSIGTQKTKARYLQGAEGEFHVYALEWTEDYIKTYVDGEELFYFANDKTGNKNTWPFNAPFYLKLNLAWGGDWGGYKGVDESALPATYEIDYVRVFQKK